MPLQRHNKIIIIAAMAAMLLLAVLGHDLKRGLGADQLTYYLYLPATFIYHSNTTLDRLPENKNIPKHILLDVSCMKSTTTPKGYTQNPYTYGVALMEAPFFFIAHAWELARGGDANGFSGAYPALLDVCAAFYALAGLLLIYSILRRYFSESISVLTVVIILLGTNLFWFTIFQSGMSHSPLFFLYAAVMYLTIRIHERPAASYFLLLGLTIGVITLIRPSDIICLLIPLLYGVSDRASLRVQLKFIGKVRLKILLAATLYLLPILPQLLYWKMMTGSFVYYSYGNQGFNWSHPHIIEGLFYAENGWLMYTPVMIFALAGLTLFRKIRPWAVCIYCLLPIYVYVIYSWYCYSYINGFGSRPMIHLYPLLAIPLAAFIDWVQQRGTAIKTLFMGILALLVATNISYSIQEGKYMIISDFSNLTYNLNILFRSKMKYDDLVVFDTRELQPDTTRLQKVSELATQQFNDSLSPGYVRDTLRPGNFFYEMRQDDYHPGGISIRYSKARFGNATWLRCSGRFMYPQFLGYHLLVLNFQDKKWQGCKIENKIDVLDGTCKASDLNLIHSHLNYWGTVSFFSRIPDHLPDGAEISCFVWNVSKTDLLIDSISVDLYR